MLLLAPTPPPSPATAHRRPGGSAASCIRCSSVRELDRSPSRPPLPALAEAKRVVLVRHGQSTWNADGRIQGSSDFSVLTPKGESQAETSRLMLLADSFDACFTSPLARSRRTAEIIWDSRDKDLIPDYDLREIDLYSFQVGTCSLARSLDVCANAWQPAGACGNATLTSGICLQGLLKHEGKEKYGALFQQWQKSPSDCSIDGHYPVRELWDRAQGCWERILTHEGKSVLVVAHNAVNQALVATSLGLGTEYFRTLLQSNCGASVLDFTPQPGGRPPNVCLNRLNQTPNSPISAESSAGRKSSKRIILVCQGATQSSSEGSLGGVGYAPLNMLGVIQAQKTAELLLDLKVNSIICSPQVAAVDTATAICEVQEAADCLGADCVPRYVEMKNLLGLEIDDAFLTKQKSLEQIVQSGWMGGMEHQKLKTLWAQSEDAWQALVNELPEDDGAESDQVVVAIGHPAIHLGLLCRCLNLTMDYMPSFHLDDGSISVIDFPDGPKGGGIVRCTNYTAHLGRWSLPITKSTENNDEF
ncbi:2-carboxy-D-arabinitol-1-phosphatase isoform X1 [Triticum dicoccoides]|uniref:2-carboxy-D-arabinitol-1-phosphatase n=1 Tax=Triticum aestivum TaxID=4565 RepID=A0A3B6HTW9_WHEAT|nr:2-carboxy-D-arabinitol-1-phosphatase isoform X1 [Triticum dicoccoides]XP_044364049.1 2-carboxy-D-arabinitol-1-phosphatase-like isoform X1 [Triticum aestivum]